MSGINWLSPTLRSDGLEIQRDEAGWSIHPPARVPRLPIMRVCPCCHEPISTAAGARRVADKELPLEPDPPAAA